MIIQALIDFFRDVFVNWLTGLNGLLTGVDPEEAGTAIGSVAASAAHILALFISPGVWGAVVTTWGIWLTVWLATALIAIIARRGTSS